MNVLRRIIEQWVPEELKQDLEVERKARLCLHISGYVTLLTMFYVPRYYFTYQMPFVAALVAFTGAGVLLVPFILRTVKSVIVTGHQISSLFFMMISIISYYTGGLEAVALTWLVIPSIFAVLIINRKAGIFYFSAALAEGIIFLILHRAGHQFPHSIPASQLLSSEFTGYISLLIAIFAFVNMFESGKNIALNEAKKSHRKAQEYSEELQALVAKTESEKHAAVEQATHSLKEQEEYLRRNVTIIQQKFEQFSEGNLTVQLTAERDDSIGQICRSFNEAVNTINGLIIDCIKVIQSNTKTVAHIHTSGDKLLQTVQHHSRQSDKIAGMVDEISRLITNNASAANDIAKIAKFNEQKALQGGTVMEQTLTKIHKIAGVVEQSSLKVEQLGESGVEISAIISTIDEIADQTNLLALNATIEAARAGEHGRGFAVVADEVRKLAERTGQATKQIAVTIQKLQNETREAVEAMRKGNEEVKDGITLADEAGQALQSIVSGVQKVQTLITNIAGESRQQAEFTTGIAHDIKAMARDIQESARIVTEISTLTTSVAATAETLQNLISVFETQEQYEVISELPTISSGVSAMIGNGHDTGVRQLPKRREVKSLPKKSIMVV